jgi:hypothetical protein
VRARLILKLISVLVVLALTALGARSCTASSPSSPLNPVNVAHNGLSGVCANDQAVADAGGSDASGSPGTAISPALIGQLQASDPNGLSALEQSAGGSLACPTTTDP